MGFVRASLLGFTFWACSSSIAATDLGQSADLRGSVALAINRNGVVGGAGLLPRVALQSKTPGPPELHAMTWTKGAQGYEVRDLSTLGGTSSLARAVNENGQVAGSSEIFEVGPGGGCIHAFLWTNGTLQDLGTLGGEDSYAYGVNVNGRVVGQSQLPKLDAKSPGPPQVQAFLWSPGAGMTPLAPLPGGRNSSARAMNSLEQIVGMSEESDGPNDVGPGGGCVHATLWTNGLVQDLGTLAGAEKSAALAINDQGQIAGVSQPGPGALSLHAVLWTAGPNGYVLQDLGTLGGDNSVATGINGQGLVTGYSQTLDGSVHAFVWSSAAGLTDLGSGPGEGGGGFGINDAGKIVGVTDLAGGAFEMIGFVFDLIPHVANPPKKAQSDDWTLGDEHFIRRAARTSRFDAFQWDLLPPPNQN